jgi:hypothetical protein
MIPTSTGEFAQLVGCSKNASIFSSGDAVELIHDDIKSYFFDTDHGDRLIIRNDEILWVSRS